MSNVEFELFQLQFFFLKAGFKRGRFLFEEFCFQVVETIEFYNVKPEEEYVEVDLEPKLQSIRAFVVRVLKDLKPGYE